MNRLNKPESDETFVGFLYIRRIHFSRLFKSYSYLSKVSENIFYIYNIIQLKYAFGNRTFNNINHHGDSLKDILNDHKYQTP